MSYNLEKQGDVTMYSDPGGYNNDNDHYRIDRQTRETLKNKNRCLMKNLHIYVGQQQETT